ncbi:hypothetical protein GCM10027040_12120 [Halomonas shantousis]
MISLSFKKSEDSRFAERMIIANMQADYLHHGIEWDSIQFRQSWLETCNYLLEADKQVIGLVRMNFQNESCYLNDLQVMKSWQGQGVGSKALDEVLNRAREAGCLTLRLKVFADSDAVRLYLRKGLQIVKQEGPLLFMEARL